MVRHDVMWATLVRLATNCWCEEGNDYHGKPSWIRANPGSRELRLDDFTKGFVTVNGKISAATIYQ